MTFTPSPHNLTLDQKKNARLFAFDILKTHESEDKYRKPI